MTKEERKALQNFMNRIEGLEKSQMEIFYMLQKENERVNGNAWCSAETNMIELVEAGERWAKKAYEDYVKLGAKVEVLSDYGDMLAELKFWK